MACPLHLLCWMIPGMGRDVNVFDSTRLSWVPAEVHGFQGPGFGE